MPSNLSSAPIGSWIMTGLWLQLLACSMLGDAARSWRPARSILLMKAMRGTL